MNETIVIDANIALKWVVNEPDSETAIALLEKWTTMETIMLAPILFTYEVTNILFQAVRKGTITIESAKEALQQIMLLGIEIDSPQYLSLSLRAIELADQYNLSATYDPHYLALAEREGCEFWTADLKMWNAIKGKINWVRYIGDYDSSN
jgi:predicted nucleic acid-binding protein